MTAIRVLVVDDSALVRRLIRAALVDVEGIEIVGLACDGCHGGQGDPTGRFQAGAR